MAARPIGSAGAARGHAFGASRRGFRTRCTRRICRKSFCGIAATTSPEAHDVDRNAQEWACGFTLKGSGTTIEATEAIPATTRAGSADGSVPLPGQYLDMCALYIML